MVRVNHLVSQEYVKRGWRLFNFYTEEIEIVKTSTLSRFNLFFGVFPRLQSFGKVM